MFPMFDLAAKVAMPDDWASELRRYWLGAVGIRSDGVVVSSKNGAVHSTHSDDYRTLALAHAECRVLRKLGKGGTIYVARIARFNKDLAMARPCGICRSLLKAHATEKVFYTIDPAQYGIWYPAEDRDEICSF